MGKTELSGHGLFANAQPFVSDENRKQIDHVLGSMARDTEHDHANDRMRVDMLNAMVDARNDATILMSEQMSDSLALLSLIKEGRLQVRDIEAMAKVRDKDAGSDHHTSDFLRAMQKSLTDRPDVVAGWQKSHQKDLREGRGLQIDDQLSWLQPLWIGHANGLKKAQEQAPEAVQKKVDDSSQKVENGAKPREFGIDFLPFLKTNPKSTTSSSMRPR